MDVLINIDVPDLAAATAFYTHAFGLTLTRRLGPAAVELSGLPARIYLLEKPAESSAAGGEPRRYDRHWTPVHLDIVVADIAAATVRAVDAGAVPETELGKHAWGSIAEFADPFGHGFCLIEFSTRGYDSLADDVPNDASIG